MAVRIALALTAVLVLGWTGVLLRDYELARDPTVRSFYYRGLGAADRARDLRDLQRSRFLNPDTSSRVAEAAGYLESGKPRRATQVIEPLVRSQPDNARAWGMLARATARIDPARSAAAARRLRRLNPLAVR